MPNPNLSISLNNPPNPNATVVNVGALVTLLNTLLQGSIQGSYMPYVVGSSVPAVNDQDKIWARLDNSGRPIGLFLYFNGNWRRFYNGKIGEVSLFVGDPTVYFDATGLGQVGLDWDGWALMNGQNGTVDRSNQFIATANMNNSGGSGQYASGQWQSFVDGKTVKPSGGAATYLLTKTDLPNIRVIANGFAYQPSGNHPDRQIVITGDYAPSQPNSKRLGDFGSNPIPASDDTNQTPIPQTLVPTTPTFGVMAPVQFLGY